MAIALGRLGGLLARLFRLPRGGRLLDYVRSERRTLRHGFVALLLGALTSFVAGITLANITETLRQLPGLLILIPAVLGMRGTIFGAMGARLGTSTHVGLFEVTSERTGVLYQNVYVAAMSTVFSSFYLAALAKLSALAFGLPSISFFKFVTIAVIGGIVDSTLILLLTIGISVLSYRRQYDLDAVSTPVVTAAADMLTVPILYLATFLTRVEWLNTTLAVICIVLGVLSVAGGFLTKLPLARRAFVEMAGVIVLTPLLDILAGTVIEARLHQFAALPALLLLVPSFVASAGSLGGILSSRLSSKLQMGLISPTGLPQGLAYLDAVLVVGFGVVVFAFTGAIGYGYSALTDTAHPGAGTMILATLVAGLIATAIAIIVSYYVAIITTRFRLDPDNHSVPIITSVMDLAGVICFIFTFALFGVALGA
ncbi:MAG: magnesium transporter [Actinomycetota bacterium]|nr:magnesium transporter [Actinomycetota bacterium]